MRISCQKYLFRDPSYRVYILVFLLLMPLAPQARAQTLLQALVLSWQHNSAFAIERRKTIEVFEIAKRAAIALGPTFSIAGSYGYEGSTYPPSDLSIEPDPTWQARIGVTQPLLQNGKLYRAYLVSRFDRSIALRRFQKSEAQLILDGVRLYVDTISAAAARRLSRKTEEQFQKQLEATNQNARLGEASAREVALAQALLADARAARLAAEAAVLIIEQRFVNHFGAQPRALETPETLPALPATFEEAHRVMLESSFDLDTARLELQKNRKVTRNAMRVAFFLPSINLEAQYRVSESVNNFASGAQQRRESFSAQVSAIYPLSPGRFLSGYRSLVNGLKIAERGARRAREGAEAALVSAWQNFQSAEKRRDATADAVRARQIVLESAEREVKLGTGDIDNLLDAERALAEAQRAEIVARGEALYARYAVLATTGTLSPRELGLEVERYDSAYFSKWGFSVE